MNKSKFLKILKIVLPLLIGVVFIFISFSNTTPEERNNIISAIKKADKRYVLLSIIFGFLSHLSRAYRWNYMLNPMGYFPRYYNNIFSIFIAYLSNLGIPRSGEVFRATVMKTYEKIPFVKGFGTIVSERVVDLAMLLLIILVTFFIEFKLLVRFLELDKMNYFQGVVVFSGIVILIYIIYLIFKKSKHPFRNALVNKLKDFSEGLLSIAKTKKKFNYLIHTFFIWAMYLLMFYIVKFCFPETAELPLSGVILAFVVGAFAISATNGGIGVYPYVVSLVLMQFGVTKEASLAFGWFMWSAQTFMVVLGGGLSFILLPIYNNKKKQVFITK